MSETALDIAHREMETSDTARLRFYEVFADSELFLLLAGEAVGDQVEPEAIEVEGRPYVLAFDSEERLASFAGQVSDFAMVSGRGLVEMLGGQEVGIGLNLEAPSAVLLPPEALSWLASTLAETPEEAQEDIEEIMVPSLAEDGLAALDAKLARAGGLAQAAWLVGARFKGGRRGHVLAIAGAVAGAEMALAKSIGEALVFSGLDEAAVDVTFLPEDSASIGRFALVGRRFDLPVPEPVEEVQVPGRAPGMDPSKPPKLK
ncbi:SseB family protein [Alisedimentitalea sp. MJ-SS2]|uniref:SseB family protein n=1 Tax=Aliisedimentitalea sp. MJ-SS2 TaxID=3049795 RepID=UPI00290BBF10|nr:SseB family protein [Alisedimentitalea sp. MJ-SS2]MDU8928844.1 SseB family protein [Alisedimentitalea sp. MJ-SS2]